MPFPFALRRGLSRGFAHPVLMSMLVVGTVVGFAGPASAHHPIVSGTVACASGEQVVTWTVSNSESVLSVQGGTNRTMVPDTVTVTASDAALTGLTVHDIQAGTEFPPNPMAGWTQTGTTTLPASATGTLRLYVKADWTGGVEGDRPQNIEETSDPVTLLDDCALPAVPAATLAVSCVDGGAKAVMTNTGGKPVDFIVKKDDVQVGEPVTVAPGGSETKIYAMAEDATAKFEVSAPGMTKKEATVTRNCQEPAALIDSSCTDGAIVTVSNAGQSSVNFAIFKGATQLDTVSVAGGGASETKKYAMIEGETSEYSVTAPGMTRVFKAVPHLCATVLGIQLTQPEVLPAVLPRTGSQPGRVVAFAAAIAVLGLGLRRMTRRPDSTG